MKDTEPNQKMKRTPPPIEIPCYMTPTISSAAKSKNEAMPNVTPIAAPKMSGWKSRTKPTMVTYPGLGRLRDEFGQAVEDKVMEYDRLLLEDESRSTVPYQPTYVRVVTKSMEGVPEPKSILSKTKKAEPAVRKKRGVQQKKIAFFEEKIEEPMHAYSVAPLPVPATVIIARGSSR